MQQLRLIFLLLKPSLFSFIMSIFVAIIIIGAANWSYATQQSFLYEYFYGTTGLTTILSNSTSSFSAYAVALSAQLLTYEIIIFIAAVAVTLIVYAILQSLARIMTNATNIYEEIHLANAKSKLAVELEIGTRLFIRILALIIWFFYFIFSLKILLPFCILMSQTNIEDLFTNWRWAYILLGVLLLTIGLHLHLIFMRLLMLRPRLFGGTNDITEVLVD